MGVTCPFEAIAPLFLSMIECRSALTLHLRVGWELREDSERCRQMSTIVAEDEETETGWPPSASH
jgi:hypothetical protein